MPCVFVKSYANNESTAQIINHRANALSALDSYKLFVLVVVSGCFYDGKNQVDLSASVMVCVCFFFVGRCQAKTPGFNSICPH